ncbi:MAG: DUF2336 domain-containing protein [Oceanicaulis sp.]|nr:DUF2336 domain-containing protein [Oceanicaulis sp.]
MSVPSRLNRLADLAREKSSERRRALLREVTDLFFEAPPAPASPVQAEFDAVLQTLASQTAQGARTELAERFADSALAPRGLLLQLARDAIEVAGPILSRSSVLKEEDLVTIVHERGQDHIRAVAGRERIGERLSSAIVEQGDDKAVAALVNNPGSRLNRQAFEAVTRRAETSPELQAPLVARTDTPADLLNDLMVVVETHLREQIVSRFDSLEPGVLEAALAASHKRLAARLEEDQMLAEARRFIAAKRMRKELDGALLVRLLREKKRVHFCAGFAEMTGVDYAAARRALDHDSADGLALICKAAGLDKALFVTIAVLRAGAGENAFTDARDLGKAYDDLDPDSAQRALRFMKLRKDAEAA